MRMTQIVKGRLATQNQRINQLISSRNAWKACAEELRVALESNIVRLQTALARDLRATSNPVKEVGAMDSMRATAKAVTTYNHLASTFLVREEPR